MPVAMLNHDGRDIWSIALTQNGIGTCIHNAQAMAFSQFYRWPVARIDGASCIQVEQAKAALAQALSDLCDHAECLPIAIAMASVDESTAIYINAAQTAVTPVYCEMPHPMPLADIPDKYAASPNLALLYRDSVLRRLQQTNPTLGLHEPLGLCSLGALAAFWLTGHAVSCCMPLGVPPQFPQFDADTRDACCDALGISPKICMKRARCGHAFAKISPWLAQNLQAPNENKFKQIAGIPIFDMGDCCGACAYASAADPLSWFVSLGTALNAHWTASISALAQYEIQVLDKSHNSEPPQDITPKTLDDLTSNDWTQILFDALTPNLHPGPGSALAAYGCSLPSFHSEPIASMMANLPKDRENPECIDFAALSKSPLGSHGLHWIHTQTGWQTVGMTAAHTSEDFARALFEGMCYQLRQWREKIPTPKIGPIRLILEQPWPAQSAQWVADILETPVYLIHGSRETLAAQGAAIVLLRSLEIPTKPSIHAEIFEPQERSAYYRKHYHVHCAL